MQEQLAVQNLLREKFAEAQRANPGYSLRAFARRVGVHVGALTYIINGKRNVSRDLAERILRRLLLDPQARAEVLGLFPEKRPYRKPGQEAAPAERYLRLSANQFNALAEWEHLAVLSLANCAGFRGEPAWIAERLGISLSRSQQVISRLLELGLVKNGPDGTVARSGQPFRTSDDVAELSIRRHHEENLELAKKSLQFDDVASRDFTSVTMAIDPEKIGVAKELIRKFTDELSDLLETGTRTEVFRFSTHLFPLSQKPKH